MTLRVEKISKRYGNNWALHDVGFDVADGEVFGIFGRTASGRSTLLKCIAGIEKMNGGSLFAGDADISGSDSRDIFLAGGRQGNHGSDLIRNAASAGEAKIAEVEASLASGKGTILLDDPFVSVDALDRDRLIDEIRSIARSGTIVLIASPNFEDIAVACDRVAVLASGEIHQVGTPQYVYDHPESVAVATAVGRNNLFAARRLSPPDAELPEFMTVEGGHRLFAASTDESRIGAIDQNVTLAIRPEQISISFGTSFPEDNLLRAQVNAIRFHGETTLIELDAAGLKLEARVFRVVGLEPGEEYMIGMPPDRIQVLKD
jgi:ABC-type sugar transport system ATPase subunit